MSSYQLSILAEPRREEKLSVNIPGLQDQGEVDDDSGASDGVYGGGQGGRSGSSTKGRTPNSNICYFVAKLRIVAIYALFERLL